MKHALLLVDPDIRLNQQVALGLSEELQKHEAWTVHVQSPYRLTRGVLTPGRHDAVVARGPWSDLARGIEKLSVPFVVVADEGAADQQTPAVIVDNEAVGTMAAEYLLGQQFEHVAVVAHDESFARPRIQVFLRLTERSGKKVDAFRLPHEEEGDHPFSVHGKHDELLEWLRCLPKPCAVFAHSDQLGACLIETCIRHDTRVPEEVSVLGVDDDPLFCRTVMPNLASIHVPNTRLGTEAARLILDWQPGRRLVKVQPTTVVERASVRPPERGDPLVDTALDHLRTHVATGVRVRDLQKLTGLTSHQLVYRFHAVTGRTPMEMILRQRVAVARQLLAETSDPVGSVARQCGFRSANRFYVVFRALVGMSPRQYRARIAP